MKAKIGFLGVLALLLTSLGLAIANTAAPSASAGGDAVVETAQPLAMNEEAVCIDEPADSSNSLPTLEAAAAPHCCATGAAAACRDLCRQQGPGCKGSIGCRAGECVCTCDCR